MVMVSGGWKSPTPGSFQPWMAAPLLRRGYTVFAVYHISQPEATVMEIAEEVNRAVRYIRHHARDYGVDPQRLGVTGGSAGGHLSLLLATRGGPGPADAADPVDRESSAVEAVADLLSGDRPAEPGRVHREPRRRRPARRVLSKRLGRSPPTWRCGRSLAASCRRFITSARTCRPS